jgi:hypothetical protein
MKTAKKYIMLVILFSVWVITPHCLFAAGDGLIIPMPDYKNNNEPSSDKANDKTQKLKPTGKTNPESGTLIPLPTSIKKNPTNQNQTHSPKETPQTGNDTTNETPLITIEPIEEPQQNQSEFPEVPDEIVIEPDSLEPTENLPSETNYQNEPAAGELPIFPKDTASAVFMVMKTWRCDDYNGNTLLAHAVDVYSKGAQEDFQIKGLSEDLKFNITLDEQDITLDELLDLISLKSGRDWGVDIQSKTIYFYPPGVTTDSLSAW